jgi:hypothetical protein
LLDVNLSGNELATVTAVKNRPSGTTVAGQIVVVIIAVHPEPIAKAIRVQRGRRREGGSSAGLAADSGD